MTAVAEGVGRVLEPGRLARYADAIVRASARLAPGDALLLDCQPAHRELAVALAESAYAAGARLVDVSVKDPLVRAARIRHAADEHLGGLARWHQARWRAALEPDTVMITILGEGEADPLAGLPPARVAADLQRPLQQAPWYVRGIRAEKRTWVGASWPTPVWAAQVYPELDVAEAQRRLADDLLRFCRLGPDDPPGAEGWTRHVETLAARAERLTDLGLERLELRGPGTELSLRLAPGTRWLGGLERNAHGRLLAGNIPTEENYTSPDAAGTEGTFRCTRPLELHGRLIDDLRGEFRRGRLVRLEAATDEQRDFVAALLDSDPGARRLGEVALVDGSSRIGREDRVYRNTLLDENAAAHIAFGFGFDSARLPRDGARGARGVNRSNVHLDVMIGSDDLEATGFGPGGRRVALVAGGAWQV